MTKSPEATKDEVLKLQQVINDGASETISALNELSGNIAEHDEKYQSPEPASSYFAAAIETAKRAVAELQKTAEAVRNAPPSEMPMTLIHESMARVNDSLAAIKVQAASYDEKLKISTKICDAKEAISTSLHDAVNTARDRVNAVITDATAQVNKVHETIRSRAAGAGSSALAKVGELDDYYQVSSKVSSVAAAATDKARELDEYYGVSQKAADLDQRVTGGYGAAAVAKGTALMHQGVDFVSEKIATAKLANSPRKESVVTPDQ